MNRSRPTPLALALVLLAGLAGSPRPARAFGRAFTHTVTGAVDGLAVGDIDGSGRQVLAVLSRGGTYAPGVTQPGLGSLAVVDAAGAVRWQVQTGTELAGYPVMADLEGHGTDDVAFCEIAPQGYCHVYDGRGHERYRVGPFFYPGMSTAGPAAADVNGDGIADLVIATWGGQVIAVDGPTGHVIWRQDVWASDQELLFGQPAIGDVTGDGRPDVVFCGYSSGNVYALDGATGQVIWSVKGLRQDPAWGDSSYANGPLLLGPGTPGGPETVLALPGAHPVVAAFGPTGRLRWRRDLPGADLTFQSPVAADVDGDGVPEILVQDGNGTLYVLAPDDGAILRSKDLGDVAWVAPAFADIDGDGIPEIVATTQGSVQVLDGTTLAVRDRYDDPTGGLMPTPAIADLGRGGVTDVVTASWWTGQLVALTLPTPATYRWGTLGGGARRAGVLDTRPRDRTVATGYHQLLTRIQTLIADPATPPATARALQREALRPMTSAYQALLAGRPQQAVSQLRHLVQELGEVPGPLAAALQAQAARLAIATAQAALDRAAALAGPNGRGVQQAQAALASARAALAQGDVRQAVSLADHAIDVVSGAGRGQGAGRGWGRGPGPGRGRGPGPAPTGSFCPASPGAPYLVWECRIQAVRDQVAAQATATHDPALGRAADELTRALQAYATLGLDQALDHLGRAVVDLGVSSQDTTGFQADLARAASRTARIYLDDVATSGLNPRGVTRGEALWQQGEAARATGDFVTAIADFRQAIRTARP